jgi:hypothetical protein
MRGSDHHSRPGHSEGGMHSAAVYRARKMHGLMQDPENGILRECTTSKLYFQASVGWSRSTIPWHSRKHESVAFSPAQYALFMGQQHFPEPIHASRDMNVSAHSPPNRLSVGHWECQVRALQKMREIGNLFTCTGAQAGTTISPNTGVVTRSSGVTEP